ncbi:TIGR02270 family protein [Myxococcus sp. MxC21-1]|uniref:TIGR02270 family protein n=1 Tax=Myxococcus sp. MxC21-1 TaxID=3041439 RepID=UPI00292CCB06|nr:TIGR02270 family protein [Myxococcus sp. MxC21-1]WNZ65875.1 TIGR02270 family protein [Myxococcus sp. MxC21-1]
MNPLPRHLALPISWEMLASHLDEAAFLWRQWKRARVAPDHVLDDVAGVEARLLAHVDALVLAGRKAATRLLVPALAEADEPGRVECAALGLLLQEDALEAAVRSVLEVLQAGEEGPCAGIQAALLCAGGRGLESWLRPMVDASPSPGVLATLLEILGAWRVDPGPALEASLTHEAAQVRAAAFRCLRSWPVRLSESTLELGLRSPSAEVSGAALEAGLLAGSRLAWWECRRQVLEGGPHRQMALRALAVAGGPDAQKLLLEGLGDAVRGTETLRVVGLVGTVETARACLEAMREPSWARLAAESFSLVTGMEVPAVAPAVESGDAEAAVEFAPEADLPLPDVPRVEAWWAEHASRFKPAVRYVRGRPLGQESLLDALREGSMYRRRSLWWAVALRTRGALGLGVGAWTRTQRAEEDAARRLPPARFAQSLEGGLGAWGGE